MPGETRRISNSKIKKNIRGIHQKKYYVRYKRREKMFKAFNSKQLTNNKHIISGSREKQYLLFLSVHLISCYAFRRTYGIS